MKNGGTGNVKLWLALAAVVLAVVAAVFCRPRNETGDGRGVLAACRPDASGRQADRPAGNAVTTGDRSGRDAAARSGGVPAEAGLPAEDLPQIEQEKLVAATELLVEEFDSLVDAWRGQSDGKEKAKPVTMVDVDNFAKAFRRLPKDRRDECVHRALNLIPDENVMLLAGILMDKAMDKEIVETVYNDILNRDEDVKKPILQQIFKDKTHPCWADTAWILDVTGELPKSK